MIKRVAYAFGAALAGLAAGGAARADETLSNANIYLDIRGDNAAIDTLSSFGYDNFNPGTPVSDWGFMLDGQAATFRLNGTEGGGLSFGPLTNTGGVISGSANFVYGGYALTLTREYQLVGDSSVQVTTYIQNNGQAIGTLLGFDTFDPDIGIPRSGGFPTYNDVFTDDGILIGLASDNVTTHYSVALGVTDSRAVVASGYPFQIDSASLLTGVATSPYDANGAYSDEGLHVVFSTGLASGASTSFQYFLNFGTSPAEALTALASVMSSLCPTSGADDICMLTSDSDQNVFVNAQGGTDTLQLGGTTNFNFDVAGIGTTYTNFETFEKVGTSTVTLTGAPASTTQAIAVKEGTLVAGAGTLGSASAQTVAAGATLKSTGNNSVATVTGLGTFEISGGAFTANLVAVDHFVIEAGSLGGGVLGANTADILGGTITSQLRVGNANDIEIAEGAQITSSVGTTVLWAADATGDGVTIVNAGTIHTTAVADAIGVFGTRSGAFEVTNSGSIISDGGTALYFGNPDSTVGQALGPVTITNSGTISGVYAITTGGGNDTFNQTTSGIVVGRIDMGGGTNTLNLSGEGASTFYGENSSANPGSTDWVGFTDVNVNGGTWTLLGGGYYDNLTIASGATMIANDTGLGGASDGGIGEGASGGLNLTVNGTFKSVSSFPPVFYAGNPNLVVSGKGEIELHGGGVVLAGANTFSGQMTIWDGARVLVTGAMPGDLNVGAGTTLFVGGTLAQIGVDGGGTAVYDVDGAGATGDVSGGISIASDGSVVFNRSNDLLYAGELSGDGKVTKAGAGMLSLSGDNADFAGGIDIVHGGIKLLSNTAAGTGPITTFGSVISYGNGVNSAAPIVLSSNTTQLEVLTGSAEQSGAISEVGGSRPLEKIGAGEMALSGANSFSGAMTITAGTLTAQGGSALSNTSGVSVSSGATLRLNTSETIGRLTGAGGLDLSLGTILTTGGDDASTIYSGASSGAGGVTKTGTGTWTLTGANSFGGAFDVAAGNLTVTPGGSLSNMSAFSVQSGASAFLGAATEGVDGGGMTGSNLGALSVANGGTLYLDDTTSLSGASLTLASGANLDLFLTTNTAVHPQITLTGAANVTGANVGVYLDPLTFGGTTATSFTYNNVISGASATGTFGSVEILQAPNDLFTISAIYNPTNIGLQIYRNPFDTLGTEGFNQGSVGGGIEEVFESGPSDPDLQNLINTIAGSTPEEIAALFTEVSGSTHDEDVGAALKSDDPWKQSVAERVNAVRATGCTVAGDTWCLRRYAQAQIDRGTMSDVVGDPHAFDWLETGIRDPGTSSVWGRLIGAYGEVEGDLESPGSRQLTGGMIAGADHVFDSLMLAGLALQYAETDVDFDASANVSTTKTVQLGAYVSYGGAEAYLNGNASIIGAEAEAERFLVVGPSTYNITSFMRSWTYTLAAEAGTIMEIDGYRFEPSFGLNYQAAFPEDYSERGGGGLSLLMQPDDSQSLRSILSARVSRVFDIGDRKFVPQFRIDWRHEFLDRRQEFEAAFSGAPDIFFHVNGSTSTRDTLSSGFSVTTPITGKITGYVDAQGAVSEDSLSAMVSVGGRMTW